MMILQWIVGRCWRRRDDLPSPTTCVHRRNLIWTCRTRRGIMLLIIKQIVHTCWALSHGYFIEWNIDVQAGCIGDAGDHECGLVQLEMQLSMLCDSYVKIERREALFDRSGDNDTVAAGMIVETDRDRRTTVRLKAAWRRGSSGDCTAWLTGLSGAGKRGS